MAGDLTTRLPTGVAGLDELLCGGLVAGRAYELHYSTGADSVNSYLLFVVADNPANTLAAAAAPSTGDWAGTGMFDFVATTDPATAPTPPASFGPEYSTCAWIADDIAPGETAAATGHLCTITPATPGELNLHLYTWSFNTTTHETTESQTTATFQVQ